MEFKIADTLYDLSLDEKTDEEKTDYPSPIFNFSPDSEKKFKINEKIEDLPTSILDFSLNKKKDKKDRVPILVLDDSSYRQKKRKFGRSIFNKNDREKISPDNSPIFGKLKKGKFLEEQNTITKVAFEIFKRNYKHEDNSLKYIN